MTLHPEVARVLATLPPAPASIDPVAMRAAEEAQVPPLAERLPLHRVEDLVADTAAGPVPVRSYTPVDAGPSGLVVLLHGGAFFLGSLETHDGIARAIAAASGLRVLSVGYRLAPEHAFPAGLADCLGVLHWAAEHGERLGWDGGVLALAGDSSGGTFVAALTGLAHDEGFNRVTHQILLYPSLDLDFDEDRYPSLRENAVGYGLETAGLAPFNALYFASGADPADPRVSPIKRPDLRGLPPALIVTAEHDPLRDEGERYGELLREAGVSALVHRYQGAGHGFVQHFAWVPEFAGVFDELADFLGGGR